MKLPTETSLLGSRLLRECAGACFDSNHALGAKVGPLADDGYDGIERSAALCAQSHLNRYWRGSLRANVSRVKAPCNSGVSRPFNDGSSVGEEGHLVGVDVEAEREFIGSDDSQRTESLRELFEIQRPSPFVNLDGVSAAKTDRRTVGPLQPVKDPLAASPTVSLFGWLLDLADNPSPEIHGGDFPWHLCSLIRQDLDRSAYLQSSNHGRGCVQDSGCFTRRLHTLRRSRIDTGETGFSRNDRHHETITAHGRPVDPGFLLGHGEIIDEIAGLEIIGTVQD